MDKTIECDLCRIRYEGEHGVAGIVADRLQHRFRQLPSQFFAFFVDVTVGATGEIDALKRAGGIVLGFEYLLQRTFTTPVDNQCLTRLQFLYVLTLKVECRLQYRALTCQHDNLIVSVIERRSDGPWVSDGEHLTRPCLSADDISAVKVLHGRFEDIAHLYVFFNIIGDGTFLKSEFLRLHEVALHLTIKPVPHQFQQDISVAVDAGTLSLVSKFFKDIPDVCHIEVAAHTEVLCFPVVPSQERMDISKATLAGSGVPEVAHIKLSCKGKVCFYKRNIRQLFLRETLIMLVYVGENLGNGILSLCTFTEHVFITRL